MVSKVLAGLVSCVVVLSSCSWATETSIAGRHHCNVDNSESPYSEEETVVTEDSEESSTEDAEGLGVGYYSTEPVIRKSKMAGKNSPKRFRLDEPLESSQNNDEGESSEEIFDKDSLEDSLNWSIGRLFLEPTNIGHQNTVQLEFKRIVSSGLFDEDEIMDLISSLYGGSTDMLYNKLLSKNFKNIKD
jgi:hypothetical protein